MRWPPYDHIFFDCDSTLTAVEGIDILAEAVGKKWRVEVLTNAAMDGKLDLEEIYAKRLRAINPTHKQIRQIRRDYKRHVVEDAKELIAALHAIGKRVYIISGGLLEPVQQFGIYLGVPKERIRAVDVAYDQLSGDWWDNDKEQNAKYMKFEEGALTISDGKAQIVEELLAEADNSLSNGRPKGKSMLIGDGNSDLLASRAVDQFIGYGGVVARKRVLAEAPVFLHSRSLSPLLPFAAGPAAIRTISPAYKALFIKGLQQIETGAITFQDEQFKQKFNDALNAQQ